jgi:hypothetical protein
MGKKQAILGVVGGVVLVVAAVLILRAIPGRSEAGEDSRLRTLIDAKTSEVFNGFRISDGDQIPYTNPKTGERTLYPAEACYWNADGTAKLTPTLVFVKAYQPGVEEETVCPDCGRKVVLRNPMPPTDLLEAAAKREGKLK